jgi:hypothetical protein
MKKLIITTSCLLFIGFNAFAQEQKEEKQKPKAVYQVGSAKVVVWENKREGKHGEFTTRSYKVEKVYEKDGEWKTTSYFNEDELLELKAAIDKAILEEQVKVK